MKVKLFILLSYLLLSTPILAQRVEEEDTDTLAVSLLTVEPSKDPSSIFGHISIRIIDKKNNTDITYHHGGYDANLSFFPIRFVLGSIMAHDYRLTYEKFKENYLSQGRSFTSIDLNLTPAEKSRLIETINDYSTSGLSYYRYDYLRENCSTKVINAIRRSLDGEIIYHVDNGFVSLRSLIWSYFRESPWMYLYLNMLMGYGFDKGLDIKEQNFLPRTLTDNLQFAYIKDDNGNERKLTGDNINFIKAPTIDNNNGKTLISPLVASCMLLLLICALSLCEYKRKQIFWIVDAFLYGMYGLVGCFVAFVCIKTQLPYVSENLLAIWFNPIHLFYLPLMLWFTIKKRKDYYHVINLFLFSLFLILFKATPQVFPIELIPVALIFILRSGIHILFRFFPNYLTSNR